MSFNMLIVDDSSSMRSVIKKTIQMSGFDVGVYFDSANGEEALGVLKKQWVDVILTDIHMPIMDGLSLLRKLREDELLKSIPVIIITTEGREQKLGEAMNLGARVCIQKPFTPEQIRRTLTSVLGADHVTDDQRNFGESDF